MGACIVFLPILAVDVLKFNQPKIMDILTLIQKANIQAVVFDFLFS